LAPPAASLAVSAALALYARASDKQAAFAQLDEIAEDMIRRWPDKAEADDARIALGQASLVRGEYAAACAAFEEVNPRSARYAAAMFLWRRYLIGRSNAGSTAELEALIPQRDKAEQQLRASLELHRQAAGANPALADQVTDAQLLLAELQLEAGRPGEAAELVGPLAEAVASGQPKPLANTQLRVLLAAARAQAALEQFDKLAASVRLVADLGQDNATVNGVLNTMFKLLVDTWKQAEADAIEARTASDSSALATAEAAAVARKKFVADALPPLTLRAQNTLAAQIYIADTASQLGESDTARNLYQSILGRADNDSDFKQANENALTRIRAELVGLLRQKGQFSEALAEVETLIEKYPNALEPLMEKGRVLQGWADIEPQRFNDAVAHWTTLRTRLAHIGRKPPEYYEVVYNAANCLFTESLKSNDPEKALQAEQLLNATLVLSPRLNGPETVARYKELLQKARQLQGRPTATRSGG
jgi:tetratricopeptide (TPR) repeat protein